MTYQSETEKDEIWLNYNKIRLQRTKREMQNMEFLRKGVAVDYYTYTYTYTVQIYNLNRG